MIFTGLLSLLQILFLPGLIFIFFIRRETGLLYRIIIVVAFSMLFNLLYIILLVSLHGYNYYILLITIFCEIVIILFMYWKFISQPIGTVGVSILKKIKNSLKRYFDCGSRKQSIKSILMVLKITALILASITVGWIIVEFINQIGTVFSWWDSVLSYNRWATEWAMGIFPTGACEYPQLLPINWSLTYVLTQSQVAIFAKLIQGIFPILFVLTMFDLGLTYGSAGFIFGVPFSIFLLKKFVGVSIFEGYMDVAVTTFILLSFYMILKDLYLERYSQKTIWLSGIVILAAAMTKQSGTLAFGAWFLINVIIILSKKPQKIWKSIKELIFPTFVILIVIISWYVFKINRDALMGETSCIAITNSWASNDFRTGFWNIFVQRLKYLDLWVILIPLLIISVFFSKGGVRLLLLGFGFPYLLVSLSYGLPTAFIRYLTPLAFIFAFSVSILIDKFITFLLLMVTKFPVDDVKTIFEKSIKVVKNLSLKIYQISIWLILIIGLAIITFVGLRYPDSKLMRNYEIQQMGIGNRVINEYLVDFYKDKASSDLTLSWYPFVNYLPGLEGRAVIVFGAKFDLVVEYLNQENTKFVLQYNSTPGAIVDYLNNLVKEGQLIFITDFGVKNDAVLYEVMR